jgi:phage FluMu protein Com
MDKQLPTVGERADKLCAVCQEERGHIITSVTKHGHISRVKCPKCGTVSTFKRAARTAQRLSLQPGAPYDQTRMYRTGQTMTHSTYGQGEVVLLVEPQKIDVLFSDRMRRLVHAR